MNRISLLALVLASSLLSSTSHAQQSPVQMSNIFRGMADMMALMAQMGGGATSGANTGGNFNPMSMGSQFNPMSMGSQINPMSMGRYANPQQWMMNPYTLPQGTTSGMGLPQQMPFRSSPSATDAYQNNAPAWQNISALQGIWQSNRGEYFYISGNIFSIRSGNHTTSGQLSIQGNRLNTYTPSQGVTRSYEFALKENKLALRDGQGQILLFQRSQLPLKSSPSSQTLAR